MSASDDDLGGEEDQLKQLRSVWVAMREADEDPPDRGLDALMAAARSKAADMAPPPRESFWTKVLATFRRPPVLALASVTVLLGGALFVAQRRDRMQATETAPSADVVRESAGSAASPPPETVAAPGSAPAAALARAPTVDEACAREARLAVACNGCHVATGVVPVLSSLPALPPDKPTVEARMARHVWATDRLWEAAVGGGDEPWVKGLEILSAAPIPFRASMDDRVALAKQLQRLATTALKRKTTDTWNDRARVYGEILSVCATCHTASPK